MKGQARDPLAFLCCRANPAPQSCLPHEIAAANSSSNTGLADSAGCDSDRVGDVAAASGGRRREINAESGVGGCLDAARQAAALVANSLNLPPRLRALTVEAAVAEATTNAIDEAEFATAGGRIKAQPSVSCAAFYWHYLCLQHDAQNRSRSPLYVERLVSQSGDAVED